MAGATTTGTQIAGIGAERRWLVVRIGLVLLGLGQGYAAVWALFAPRSFFDGFPGGGAHWVSALPPYNEHLVRDYGSAFLAIAALALVAAWLADRRVARVALAIWALAAAPHLAFHLSHPDEPSGASGVASLATLALNLAVPLFLLVLIPKEAHR